MLIVKNNNKTIQNKHPVVLVFALWNGLVNYYLVNYSMSNCERVQGEGHVFVSATW